MQYRSIPWARWFALLSIVLMTLDPTALRLAGGGWHGMGEALQVCSAVAGGLQPASPSPDPADPAGAHACCPLCHLGWAPAPAAAAPRLAKAFLPTRPDTLAPRLQASRLWASQTPRAPPRLSA